MITAGILCCQRSLICCVYDRDVRWPRFESVPRTDRERRRIRDALLRLGVESMVLSVLGREADPIGELCIQRCTTVLLCDDDTLSAAILMHQRRPGRRTQAAMLARMPHHSRWRAALRTLPDANSPF